MTALLELDDIHAYYGKSHILHGISLSVGDNEAVALLGRNGAGKTTTIQSVMGVTPRVEGDITLRGERITGKEPDGVFNSGISWIPEQRRIFSNLTVADNLRMGLKKGGRGEDPYERIYELFPRLEERTMQKAGTLSGGEQQMLTIARGLLSDPDILLIDEPFEGLMPKYVNNFADVIRELKEQNRAMLIASQKTQKVLELVDRVYLMEAGQIHYSGSAEDLADDEETQREYLGVQ